MTPQLVIFDCDGVLVDTEPASNAIVTDSFARYGLHMSPQDVHSRFAGGTLTEVGDGARAMGAKLPDRWESETYDAIFAALADGVAVIPGVVDLLDQLDAAGIATAIASNGSIAKMRISLKPSGLFDRFAGRIYAASNYAPKPDPAMLLQAMDAAGAVPDRTCMIDDMPAGWRAAQAARVRCFAYVADGGPARADGFDATPVTHMDDIARALNV